MDSEVTIHRARLWPPILLALLWGVGPALPALMEGQLLGHEFTDLYPSVWGLWLFSETQPGLPAETALLGFPEGMGFIYSSPIKGWLATPLIPLLGLPNSWNLLLIAARVATVLAAWLAARAWGLGERGALCAATVYGCAPFFHGYAVEGIVEGTDGWTLALWAWALGRQRLKLAAVFLALTAWSSWYLGVCACLLTILSAFEDRRRLWSLAGLLLVLPLWWKFSHAFGSRVPLSDEVRAAMGASLQIPRPGLSQGLNFSAMTAWIGVLTLVAAAAGRRRWLGLALIPGILSLGIGPWYDLPILSEIRFPYRWHAATLTLLAVAAGATADRHRLGWLLGPLILLEGMLTSPVEPIIPGASPSVPAIYAHVDGPLLELPGPVARPPGEINHSRPRARHLLYYQTFHGQPSPWIPDFNSIGVDRTSDLLLAFQSHDHLENLETVRLEEQHILPLTAAGISQVMIHRCELKDCEATGKARRLQEQLESLGASVIEDDGKRCLLGLP